MPRTYKRKSDAGLIPEGAMREAVMLVLGGGKIRKVATDKGISKSVLCRYVQKYKKNETCSLVPNYKHSQVFTQQEENTLEEYLTTCSAMFYGLTPKHVRSLAYEMAKKSNISVPQTWADNHAAGVDWFNCFMKRHPRLSIRCPEATSLARATAFNEHNIKAFFDVLEPVVKKLNVGGRRIFNLDETGCTTVQRVPKVVAAKGCKQVGQVTSRERGELVTMCAVVSATGISLPPIFIFPRKNFREVFMTGTPEGSLGLANQSGWMNTDNFVKVIEHVAKHTQASPTNEIILVMDNHESHVALNCVVHAKECGINIVTLPPHTSNKTQPLDLSVFGPFKSYFNSTADSWMLKNPGKTITIYQMGELMGSAWVRAATPSNIASGFQLSGIWPLNRDAFTSQGYLPSTVTDRELPVAAILPTEDDEDLPEPISEVEVEPAIATPSDHDANNRERRTPDSSASTRRFVSPQEFRGYPKVSSICRQLLQSERAFVAQCF